MRNKENRLGENIHSIARFEPILSIQHRSEDRLDKEIWFDVLKMVGVSNNK